MRHINEKFADLGSPRRIWAVAAIYGDKDRLMALHDHLACRFAVKDRLVYMGNYVGATAGQWGNTAVMEELLSFRTALLAKRGMEPSDIVHMRGPAEEAWQRLLRLQFSPAPGQMLEKLLEAGAEHYLRLYGLSVQDARAQARAGSVAITRWTSQLRAAQRAAEGHEPLFCSMKRAAFTSETEADNKRLLFVPAGYDESRSLEDQGDQLWFGQGGTFDVSEKAALKFARIVRGFDKARSGISTENLAVTLDGGAGMGGPLICGCFDPKGRLREIIAVGGRGAVESMPFKDRTVPQPQTAAPAMAPASISPMPGYWESPNLFAH